VLLVREMQATNLMNMALQFGDHPKYADYFDEGEMLRQVLAASMVPTDGILRSERQVREMREQAGQQPDPAVMLEQEKVKLQREKIEADIAIAEMKAQADMRVAEMNYAKEMQVKVEELNLRDEDRQTKESDRTRAEQIKLQNDREKRQADDRRLAAEIAMKRRTGDSSGGAV